MPAYTPSTEAAYLEKVADVVWTEVNRFYQPNSCVLSTHVLVDTLRELGIDDVDGWASLTIIRNPAAARHAHRHHCQDRVCGEHALDEPESLVAVLGAFPEQVKDGYVWGGHLAARVGRDTLVDVSIAQVARPDAGLPLHGPLVMPVGDVVISGLGHAWMEVEHGVEIVVQAAVPPDEGWRKSPDWTNEFGAVSTLVEASLAQLRGESYQYPEWMTVMRDLLGKI